MILETVTVVSDSCFAFIYCHSFTVLFVHFVELSLVSRAHLRIVVIIPCSSSTIFYE